MWLAPYKLKVTEQVRSIAEWLDLERLTANGKVATGLGSNPESSDTEDSEGRQMKQC
jgi:hypothetical protein